MMMHYCRKIYYQVKSDTRLSLIIYQICTDVNPKEDIPVKQYMIVSTNVAQIKSLFGWHFVCETVSFRKHVCNHNS